MVVGFRENIENATSGFELSCIAVGVNDMYKNAGLITDDERQELFRLIDEKRKRMSLNIDILQPVIK